MVQTTTYAFVILFFILGVIGFELYFRKTPPTFGYGKLILSCIVLEFLLLTMVVLFPNMFMGLIYGSVIMGTYVCVFYRHKQKVGGEF